MVDHSSELGTIAVFVVVFRQYLGLNLNQLDL